MVGRGRKSAWLKDCLDAWAEENGDRQRVWYLNEYGQSWKEFVVNEAAPSAFYLGTNDPVEDRKRANSSFVRYFLRRCWFLEGRPTVGAMVRAWNRPGVSIEPLKDWEHWRPFRAREIIDLWEQDCFDYDERRATDSWWRQMPVEALQLASKALLSKRDTLDEAKRLVRGKITRAVNAGRFLSPWLAAEFLEWAQVDSQIAWSIGLGRLVAERAKSRTKELVGNIVATSGWGGAETDNETTALFDSLDWE